MAECNSGYQADEETPNKVHKKGSKWKCGGLPRYFTETPHDEAETGADRATTGDEGDFREREHRRLIEQITTVYRLRDGRQTRRRSSYVLK